MATGQLELAQTAFQRFVTIEPDVSIRIGRYFLLRDLVIIFVT